MVKQIKKAVQHHPKTAGVSIALAAVLVVCAAVFGWYARGRDNEVNKFGYIPNYNATETFQRSLGPRWQSLRTGAPNLFRADLPKSAPLWKMRDKAHEDAYGKKYVRGSQGGLGSCVGWGSADAVDVSFAVAYSQGKASEWRMVATESTYGLRGELGESFGYYSDGWWGSGVAKGLRDCGVLFREKYSEGSNAVDLTSRSEQRERDWGHYGTGGRNSEWLDPIAARYKIPHVAPVKTTDEAKASLANGYAIFICSGVGFDPCVRNADGVVRRGGSWSHCMACVGYYTVDQQTVFVIENSWGPNSVTGPPGPEVLSGAQFAITTADMQRIFDADDSYAVSGPNGFEPQELDFSGWGTN